MVHHERACRILSASRGARRSGFLHRRNLGRERSGRVNLGYYDYTV